MLGTQQDGELVYRVLVTVGTLVWEDKAAKALVVDLDMVPTIQSHAALPVPKVKEVVNELLSYVRS